MYIMFYKNPLSTISWWEYNSKKYIQFIEYFIWFCSSLISAEMLMIWLFILKS